MRVVRVVHHVHLNVHTLAQDCALKRVRLNALICVWDHVVEIVVVDVVETALEVVVVVKMNVHLDVHRHVPIVQEHAKEIVEELV